MTNDITSPVTDESMIAGSRPDRRSWRRPVILFAAAAVAVAGGLGVRALTIADDPPAVVKVPVGAPLIGPEEQAFINAQLGRVPAIRVGTDPWCALHRPC
jgi:hypothetical protein